MSAIAKTIFGDASAGAEAVAQQLAGAEKANRRALSTATSQEADADQALARGRRRGGGRRLLEYLEGSATLGGV